MNLKQLWFSCAIVLPFIDIITTILFTSVYGISSESNILFRHFFSYFGAFGFLFAFLYASLILCICYYGICWWSKITYIKKIRKMMSYQRYLKTLLIVCLIEINILYFFVYIINLTSLLK
jgi:hypothetical protein